MTHDTSVSELLRIGCLRWILDVLLPLHRCRLHCAVYTRTGESGNVGGRQLQVAALGAHERADLTHYHATITSAVTVSTERRRSLKSAGASAAGAISIYACTVLRVHLPSRYFSGLRTTQ